MIDDSWYQRPIGIRERISAGGVVVRRADDGSLLVALVQERHVPLFVLPKGGVEAGESLEQAARREIEEEAGLTDLTLLNKLGQLERLSYDRKQWLTTHVFLFRTAQIEGIPTDTKHHFGMWWHPIDSLPVMLWPDQKALIVNNRELIRSLIVL